MNEILKLYTNYRNKFKAEIGQKPVRNRIILSKLITNSSADSELKYVWLNRAVAEASNDNSTAILGLLEEEPEKFKILRKMTFKLRKKQNFPTPFEINTKEDLKIYLQNNKKNNIIIKQHYPNYKNEEYSMIIKKYLKNSNILIANTEEGNYIIGGNESLVRLANKDKAWINTNIENYISYFYEKNKLRTNQKEYKIAVNTLKELTNSLLIPTEFYKGNVDGLRKKITELLKKNFLPVFKFSDSISGYGVHYPKDKNGYYNIKELQKCLNSNENFLKYLSNSLCKNGQKISENLVKNNIIHKGIILQKFIKGNDYAIGFYKPLNMNNSKFNIEIADITLSNVLTNGTAHYADVLHFEEEYLDEILKNTIFFGQTKLIYFAIEIIIYLLYLNEKIIGSPSEFGNVNFEDFGIQFMVDDKTGELGLIEINGRTPSHNFNCFNIMSVYGDDYLKKIPTSRILCTSTKLIEMNSIKHIVYDEVQNDKFINYLVTRLNEIYKDKFLAVAFQISEGKLALYYNYFLEKSDKYEIKANEIEKVLKKIINNLISNEIEINSK